MIVHNENAPGIVSRVELHPVRKGGGGVTQVSQGGSIFRRVVPKGRYHTLYAITISLYVCVCVCVCV